MSGTALLMPNGTTVTALVRDSEVANELRFHLVGVDENVLGESVLCPERPSIQPMVRAVPSSRVHVMSSQNILLPSIR